MSDFKQIIFRGNETFYAVNSYGEVLNTRNMRKLKPCYFHNGRRYVNIYINGKGYKAQISRLVATAFIPNPFNYPVANHLDGDVANDCVENLEWTTFKGNMQHAIKTGLIKNKGENSPLNKYSEEMVIELCNKLMDGCSIIELTEIYDLSYFYIYELYSKNMWKDIVSSYDFPQIDSSFKSTKKYNKKFKQKIMSMIEKGYKNRQISEKLGIEHNNKMRSVYDRIRKKMDKGSTTKEDNHIYLDEDW